MLTAKICVDYEAIVAMVPVFFYEGTKLGGGGWPGLAPMQITIKKYFPSDSLSKRNISFTTPLLGETGWEDRQTNEHLDIICRPMWIMWRNHRRI
jgi:hypothetical protein